MPQPHVSPPAPSSPPLDFRALAEAFFDWVAVLDASGTIVFANHNHAQGLAREDAPLVGVAFLSLVQEEDRMRVQYWLDRLETEAVEVEPLLLRLQQGAARPLPMEYRARRLPDEAGQRRVLLHARDLSRRLRIDAELQRRDALQTVAANVGQLLLKANDLGQALAAVVEWMGLASGQDRAYLFEAWRHPETQEEMFRMRWEWVQEGIAPQILHPELQNLPFAREAPTVAAELRAGRCVAGRVSTLPVQERRLLEEQGIVSLLLMPIAVESEFWGFIGFDNCHEPYEWSAGERATLAAIATAIGGAVRRRRIEDELRERNAELTRFNEAMVNRELRMIDLKAEINTLCRERGLAPRYAMDPEAPPGPES